MLVVPSPELAGGVLFALGRTLFLREDSPNDGFVLSLLGADGTRRTTDS